MKRDSRRLFSRITIILGIAIILLLLYLIEQV